MRVKKVTGVVTQGARSFLTHMMVTEFTVSMSNNGHVWTSVLEEDTKMEKVKLLTTQLNITDVSFLLTSQKHCFNNFSE